MVDPDAKTQLMTRAKWLPPVEKVDQLPIEGVEEETRCFVDAESGEDEEVWVFRAGSWVRIDVL